MCLPTQTVQETQQKLRASADADVIKYLQFNWKKVKGKRLRFRKEIVENRHLGVYLICHFDFTVSFLLSHAKFCLLFLAASLCPSQWGISLVLLAFPPPTEPKSGGLAGSHHHTDCKISKRTTTSGTEIDSLRQDYNFILYGWQFETINPTSAGTGSS